MSKVIKKIICCFFIFIFITGCSQLKNEELDHLKKGEKLIELRKYDQAITEYKSAIKVNSSSPRAYFMLAEIYFHQSDLNRFRTQVLNFVAKYKRHPAIPRLREINFDTINQIILIEGIGNYKKALEINATLKKKEVDSLYIHYQLGWAYLVQNDYKNSRIEFNNSLVDKKDLWGAKEAFIFLDYLEKKGLVKNNIYYRGNPLVKKVALTFDDGPNEIYTPKILEILDKYKVKATFFVIGKNVKKFPHIAQTIIKAGHCIGNHTYEHINLYKSNVAAEEIEKEINHTDLIIEKTTGKKPNLFRSPYNYLDEKLIEIIKQKNYYVISWTYAPGDWEKISADKIAQRVLQNVNTGSIFLLHDGGGDRTETIKALPIIIEGLHKNGFELVDLPELLNLEE